MNIAFRVDASGEVGAGHLVRCIALALGLKKMGHNCVFVSSAMDAGVRNLITDNNFDLLKFNLMKFKTKEGLQSADYAATVSALSGKKIDALIVDNYDLDSSWESKIRSVIDNLLVIDDGPTRPHNCRILVDPNSGNSEKDYEKFVNKDCALLIGGKYALLREQFLEVKCKKIPLAIKSGQKKMLILLGGMALRNLMIRILECIEKINEAKDWSINIVIGYDLHQLKEFEGFSEKSTLKIRIYTKVSNMAELMAECDFIISAAGSTVWEICCLGLPSALLILAENQRRISEYMLQSGASREINLGSLEADLKFLFNGMSQEEQVSMGHHASRIVDGHGVARVASKLLNIG